jgi:hypothetical protein
MHRAVVTAPTTTTTRADDSKTTADAAADWWRPRSESETRTRMKAPRDAITVATCRTADSSSCARSPPPRSGARDRWDTCVVAQPTLKSEAASADHLGLLRAIDGEKKRGNVSTTQIAPAPIQTRRRPPGVPGGVASERMPAIGVAIASAICPAKRMSPLVAAGTLHSSWRKRRPYENQSCAHASLRMWPRP